MAARAPVQQDPIPLAPIVSVIAVAAAAVATWFRLPGFVVLVLGVSIAAMLHSPPQPAVRGEEPDPRAMRSARAWRELRWRLLIPNREWLLNDPALLDKNKGILASVRWALVPSDFIHIAALAAAAAALTLPADAVFGTFALPWYAPVVNAIAAYSSVAVTNAVIRRTATQYDPAPAVALSAMTKRLSERDGTAIRALVGFVLLAAAAATAAALSLFAADIAWLIVPWPLFVAAVLVLTASVCLHAFFRADGLEAWRDTVAARASWDGRWDGLKYPTMFLLSHERVGAGVCDTFEAPASLGAVGAINLYAKVVPYLGSGTVSAMLTTPDLDSNGQPIPGTAHPSRFRVATWPTDQPLDVNSVEADESAVSLRLEMSAFAAANADRMPVPILMGLRSLSGEGATAAAWQSDWSAVMGYPSEVADDLGTDAFSDGGALYFGDFDNADLDPALMSLRERLSTMARWKQRWQDVLKKDANPPTLQYDHRRTAKYDQSITINFEPFIFPQGLLLSSYFEPSISEGLSTTLKAAPFVSVIGLTGQYVPGAAPGERHAQGFAVIWSDKQVPLSPAQVAPGSARDAQKWVLAGRINAAFDAARLARPEVIDARCLTDRASKGHVWKLSLRLYGGVTAGVVKSKTTILKNALGGVPWLRVTESEHGVLLYAGANPQADGVKFVSPKSKSECDELDWEQAFLDTGLTAGDGSTPKMLDAAPLESNPKVTRFEFTLPSPLSLNRVRESVPKLRPATGNEYVDVRAGAAADRMVILACDQNPMPFPAPLDWERMLDTNGKAAHQLPFASAIDGSTVVYDWTVDPHLTVLGASGGGKSALLQILITAAIARQCQVLLVDPVKGGQDFVFAQPFLLGNVEQDDFVGAGEAMDAVYAEVARRKNLRRQYGVGKYSELPDEVRPPHLFVVVDEFQSLLKAVVKLPREPESLDEATIRRFEDQKLANAGIAKLADRAGRLGREARSDGVTLVLAGQAMKAEELARVGLGGLKTNFSRIAVGRMSWGELSSAFKNAQELPDLGAIVPPGRGLYESNAVEGRAIQVWFEQGGQAELQQRLLDVVAPISEAERIDVAALGQQVLNTRPRAFGEVIEEDDENVIVELDADDLGFDIDLGLSFEPDDAQTPAHTEAGDEEGEDVEYPVVEQDVEQGVESEEEDAEDSLFELDDEPTLFELTPTPLSGSVRVSFVRQPGALIFGVDIPLPDDPEVTGWGPADALLRLLARHPDITEIAWDAAQLQGEDDIGVPYLALVTDITARAGVRLVTGDESPNVVETPLTPAAPRLATRELPPDLFADPVIEPRMPDITF